MFPNNTFQYDFLDQDFNSQYTANEKRSLIFTVFSSLTIAIACLGLLGSRNVYYGAAHKGNWCPQGNWCERKQPGSVSFQSSSC
jgi:hypothetical protein